jgi:uncharacterized protein YbjQ (UPF0145 family)
LADECQNCGSAITPGSTFKSANERKSSETVTFVNLIMGTNYSGLCYKCGTTPEAQAKQAILSELADKSALAQDRVTDFPMLTMSWLPATADIRLKNLVTANITVGTGFFNEFTQGFSDFAGMVNVNSGMSHKVNKGEAAARSLLAMKARSLGANCIVGVDIDYGTTNNNAATVNMQGTAAVITNLRDILADDAFKKAQELEEIYARIAQLQRWHTGDIAN